MNKKYVSIIIVIAILSFASIAAMQGFGPRNMMHQGFGQQGMMRQNCDNQNNEKGFFKHQNGPRFNIKLTDEQKNEMKKTFEQRMEFKKEMLNLKVKHNYLTQEQSDNQIKFMQERFNSMINGEKFSPMQYRK